MICRTKIICETDTKTSAEASHEDWGARTNETWILPIGRDFDRKHECGLIYNIYNTTAYLYTKKICTRLKLAV